MSYRSTKQSFQTVLHENRVVQNQEKQNNVLLRYKSFTLRICILDKRFSFIQWLLVKSQDTQEKGRKERPCFFSYLWSTAECDIGSKPELLPQLCSCRHGCTDKTMPTHPFLEKGDFASISCFAFDHRPSHCNETTLRLLRSSTGRKSKSEGKCSCQPNSIFTQERLYSQTKYGITSLNLSFYRPRIKMDFISLKTSGLVQGFKIAASIQAKQSFHNKWKEIVSLSG